MVMPPLTQEQVQVITQIQQLTKDVKAEVHKGSNGSVSIAFITEDEKAKTVLPQIQSLLVSSIANVLYSLFGISGKVVS